MGFMKRVFGGGQQDAQPGPGWAGSMSAAEADALLEVVEADLRRRGLDFEMGDGRVSVVRPGEEPGEYGLSNLAQLCKQIGRRSWPKVTGEHFDNLFAAEKAQSELDATARDLDNVREMLKVRLFADKSLGGLDARPPVSWAPAPGLTAAFVYDLPTAVASVKEAHVDGWGLPHEELLGIALDNVRRDRVEARPVTDGGASASMACTGEHFFVASHAFLLDEMLPPGAMNGAVFAVPHRHALLYAPMVDVAVVNSINQLIRLAVSLFNQGPGSISPGLYWWRSGSVTLLPGQVQGDGVQFAPPDEFVQALNSLSEPS